MGIGKASIFLGWSINGKIIFDGMFVNIGRSIMGKEMGTRKLSLIVGKDDEKKASCYFLQCGADKTNVFIYTTVVLVQKHPNWRINFKECVLLQ